MSSSAEPRHTVRPPPRRARRTGFTLLECLIAGTVFAGFAIALATTATQHTRAALRAEDHRDAAERLDTLLTRIDMIGPYRLEREGPTSGVLDERFSWSATIVSDQTLPDLYRVSVTVTYRGTDGRPARVEGHTQFYDPPGLRSLAVQWGEL